MIPNKLKSGDEIRVISPSRSLGIIDLEQRKISIEALGKLGLKVTFSKNAEKIDEFSSSSIEDRIEDLHEAFRDSNVKGILTTIGGYNSNQLLKYIDYEIIKDNPKIFCGFSDITALQNAIYKKSGLVTYSGPHFSTFGMIKGNEYTEEYFKKCLMAEEEFIVENSTHWSVDLWFLDQHNRKFIEDEGVLIINKGTSEGKILGGNLCTFNLLQGTEFMPNLTNSILFIEDDLESNAETFDRDLQSLIHQPNFNKVKGILIGRFQKESNVSKEILIKIIKTKKELDDIPVVANLNFGHTDPRFTFPIGGTVKIHVQDRAVIKIVGH
ncbi:LD-carboxypeptidase [Clostridium sp. MSJ-11]|uniref:LD-carboxypeptidase n=1 Tax=Clostridium mobile TaxID=2841512 RepID=A0ABS6EEY8_9CLOT|nr:S66 peptidase family protein [Clostridium mobile]MBU5483784.1 LD-carboxypeptidase [Clostridium mobile]